MSHINVTINGRQYRMACEEGQEVRLLKLAENLETRVGELRGKFGEIGDARLTVMAALTVCDELLDANARAVTRHERWIVDPATMFCQLGPLLSLEDLVAVGDALRKHNITNATIAGGHGAIAKQADIGPALAAN